MRDGKRIPNAAHRNHVDTRREHRDELEEQIVARFRTASSKGWFEMITPKTAIGRLALASLLLVGMGIGACQMPTDTPISLGKQITLSLPREGHADYDYTDPLALMRDSIQRIESMPGVDELNVQLNEKVDDPIQLRLTIWGETVPMREILDLLREDLEPLNGVDLEVANLNTTLHESWGRKIGRELFDIKVSLKLGDSALRDVILHELSEDGQPGAEVEVSSDGQIRTITIVPVTNVKVGAGEGSLTLELIEEN